MAGAGIDVVHVDVAELVVCRVPGPRAERRVVLGVLAALGDERVRRVRQERVLPQVLVQRRLLRRELQDRVPHRDPLEVDAGVLGGDDGGGELRDVVPRVALADDEEVPALVLREPVQPLDQELQRVVRRHVVAHPLVHVRVGGVREPYAHGALQVQNVRHCTIILHQYIYICLAIVIAIMHFSLICR